MVHRPLGEKIAPLNTHGIQGNGIVPWLDSILLPESKSDLHKLGFHSAIVPDKAIGRSVIRVVGVLEVRLDKTHVRVTEERVVVNTVGGNREEISLLHDDVHLRHLGVEESRLQAVRLEVSKTDEELHSVLDADRPAELAHGPAKLDLVQVEEGGLVNAKVRIDNTHLLHMAVHHIFVCVRVGKLARERARGHVGRRDDGCVRMVAVLRAFVARSHDRIVVQTKVSFCLAPRRFLVPNKVAHHAVFVHKGWDAANRHCGFNSGFIVRHIRVKTARVVRRLERGIKVGIFGGIIVIIRQCVTVVDAGDVKHVEVLLADGVIDLNNPAPRRKAVVLEVQVRHGHACRQNEHRVVGRARSPGVHPRLHSHVPVGKFDLVSTGVAVDFIGIERSRVTIDGKVHIHAQGDAHDFDSVVCRERAGEHVPCVVVGAPLRNDILGLCNVLNNHVDRDPPLRTFPRKPVRKIPFRHIVVRVRDELRSEILLHLCRGRGIQAPPVIDRGSRQKIGIPRSANFERCAHNCSLATAALRAHPVAKQIWLALAVICGTGCCGILWFLVAHCEPVTIGSAGV
mmetsp:Transcript_74360/g.112021  ORF Transcript_74360/g.112021 Transcript_74360/m.112021 type:complete len:568 (+) Transcript_74360:2278-3981(+)